MGQSGLAMGLLRLFLEGSKVTPPRRSSQRARNRVRLQTTATRGVQKAFTQRAFQHDMPADPAQRGGRGGKEDPLHMNTVGG